MTLQEKPELPALLQFKYATPQGPIIAWLLGRNRTKQMIIYVPSQYGLPQLDVGTPSLASLWVSGGRHKSENSWLTQDGSSLKIRNFLTLDRQFSNRVNSMKVPVKPPLPTAHLNFNRRHTYNHDLLLNSEVRAQRKKLISLINRSCTMAAVNRFAATASQQPRGVNVLKGSHIPKKQKLDVEVPAQGDAMDIDRNTEQEHIPSDEELHPAETAKPKSKSKRSKSKRTTEMPPPNPNCTVYVNEEMYEKIQKYLDEQVEKMKELNISQVQNVVKNNVIMTNEVEIDISKKPVPVAVITGGYKLKGGSLVKVGKHVGEKTYFPQSQKTTTETNTYTIRELAPDDPDGVPLDQENESLQQTLYQSNIVYHYRYRSPMLMEAFKQYIKNPTPQRYSAIKGLIDKTFEKVKEKPTEDKLLQWLCFPWVQTGLLNHPQINNAAKVAWIDANNSPFDVDKNPLFRLFLNDEYKKADLDNLRNNPYRPTLLDITQFQRVGPNDEFHFFCHLDIGKPLWIPYSILVLIPAYERQLRFKYKWFMNVEKCLNFEDEDGNDLIDPDLVLPSNHKEQFDRLQKDMTSMKFTVKRMTATRLRVKESKKKIKKIKRGILFNALDHEELQLEKASKKSSDYEED